MKEELLEIVDRIESIQDSTRMPMPLEIHLECISEFLVEIKNEIIKIANKENK